MPKAELKTKEQRELEGDLVDVMFEGYGTYPQSHSDLEWCARAIMEHYQLKKRKKPIDLYTGKPKQRDNR